MSPIPVAIPAGRAVVRTTLKRSSNARGSRHHVVFPLTAFLCLAGAGCDAPGGEDDGEDGGATATPESCSLDVAPSVEEGPTMSPGGDCIGCHADNGEGPRYVVAGTVMGAADDGQGCLGVSGAIVRIVDAKGVTHDLSTNSVGNFFGSQSIATPYTAKVIRGTVERSMATAQTDTNCASCHTAEGRGGAPGRILAP